MSDVKFEKLAEFGKIHKNPKRIVVATLQRSTSTGEDGEDLIKVYMSFHEHFLNDSGQLLPRSGKNQNSRFPEKIISFTIPWNSETVHEFADVAKAIVKLYDEKPKAKERF